MFSTYSKYSSFMAVLYTQVLQMFSYYYLVLLSMVLGLFLSYRFPYGFSPLFFCVFLVCVMFTSFISLFLSRVASDFNFFLSGFVPVGTPLYMCPLVCLAETISFFIRPFVLIFRPFINITLGCVGAATVSNFCFSSYMWLLLLVLLFFYEVFVALVHWFIVTNILSFSVDH